MVSQVLFQSDHRHLGEGHDWLIIENGHVIAKPKHIAWQEFSWMEKILHILGFGRANLDTIEATLYQEVRQVCANNEAFIKKIRALNPQTPLERQALLARITAQADRLLHLRNSVDRLDDQMRNCRDKRAFLKGLLVLVLEVFRGKAQRLGGKQFGIYDQLDQLTRLKQKFQHASAQPAVHGITNLLIQGRIKSKSEYPAAS